MADIGDINATEAVRIVGSDSLGAEQTPVSSTSNGDLNIADISNNGGVEGAITVGTSATLAKVGASNLANRKTLTVFNNSNSTIYWGYTSGITTSTGTPIFKNQLAVWDVGPNTSVYLIAGSAGNNVRITENA